MKKNRILLLSVVSLFLVLFSCKKTEPITNDLNTLRETGNTKGYPTIQMDSMQAINAITKQKVQEVFDLSLLYLGGNKNTSIDSTIYKQVQNYFYKPDSLTFQNLFNELEAKNVKTAKVHNLTVFKSIIKKDTLDYAKFNVEYFDKGNKSLGSVERNAQYILVLPKKESKEFKFYLLNFYQQPVKDSTSQEVTR